MVMRTDIPLYNTTTFNQWVARDANSSLPGGMKDLLAMAMIRFRTLSNFILRGIDSRYCLTCSLSMPIMACLNGAARGIW